MTILLTGAAGFIGSHVAQALLTRGERVIGVDNFNDFYSPARKRANIRAIEQTPGLQPGAFQLVEADIRNEAAMHALCAAEQPQAIIHLAAMPNVRYSVNHPLLYQDVNIRGTLILLEAARCHHISNFVFGSSSSVYGNSSPVPFREDAPCDHPLAPYPATKRAAELMCAMYQHLYGVPCTCLRFFNAVGPRSRPDIAPYYFTETIWQEQELTLFDPTTVQRDFTYVGDIVHGILAALDKRLPFAIINLGNHQPILLRDFVAIIEQLVGKSARIRTAPLPPTDARITYADTTQARQLLGFAPATPLTQALESFWDWYKHNVLVLA
jgi:UDP-glucuronate 4-epimerase